MNTIYEINENKLILGDCTIYNNMKKFEDLNIKTVLCVKDYGFNFEYLKKRGIDVINLQLSHSVLYNEQIMKKAIMFVNKYIDNGLSKGSVYVHCRSGKNRSPLFIASYLVYKLGITPELAYRYIKKKRKLIEYTYLKVFSSIYYKD